MPNGFNSFHIRTATKSLGSLIGYVIPSIVWTLRNFSKEIISENLNTNNLFQILFSSVTHNIKAKHDIVATPIINDNDLVYITGEIAYERCPDGEKSVSVPHIFAKQIVRMENNNESDSLAQLEKGIIFFLHFKCF